MDGHMNIKFQILLYSILILCNFNDKYLRDAGFYSQPGYQILLL